MRGSGVVQSYSCWTPDDGGARLALPLTPTILTPVGGLIMRRHFIAMTAAKASSSGLRRVVQVPG